MSDEVKTAPQGEESAFKQDKFRSLAYRVVNGEIGKFTYCLENDQLYLYENGYWRKLHQKEFLAKCENEILDTKKNKVLTKFDISRRQKIIENFKILSFKRLVEFNKTHLLNLENYMLDTIGVNILKHDPKYLSTIRIPYSYKDDSSCPLWLKTLEEIFEGDQLKINTLQEFFGQCLTRDIKQEKALLLLGESRSGKSTISNTLHHLVGYENASTVPLKYILNPVYTSMMIHKLINFDKDVSKKAQDFEEDFKKIVTGEEITANDKYKEPFEFKPFCKMVLSANIFPRITDHSSAFYNRLILIPCDRVFKPEEQNRNLREDLIKELPGILNWAIEGLKRLTKRGAFEEVNFMKEAVAKLERENNPAYLFFDEHIEIEIGDRIYVEKSDLYEKYTAWAKKTGSYPISNILFGGAIFKKYNSITPKDSRLSNNGPRVWRNIRFVEFKQEKTEIDLSPAVAVDKPPSPSTIGVDSQQDINWSD